MSRKYLVATDVDGQVKFLLFTSNLSGKRRLEKHCRNMLDQLFNGRKIEGLVLRRWPASE